MGRPTFRSPFALWNCVAAQEGGSNRNGILAFQRRNDPEHFKLCFRRKAITTFDFDGPRPLTDDLLETDTSTVQQFLFRQGFQRLCRIQNAPSGFGYFLIGFSFESGQKFSAPWRGKHQVGMAIAPRGQHETASAIHHLQSRPIHNPWKIGHGPKIRNFTIFNRQPGIFNAGEAPHLCALQISWGQLICPHKAFDVLP